MRRVEIYRISIKVKKIDTKYRTETLLSFVLSNTGTVFRVKELTYKGVRVMPYLSCAVPDEFVLNSDDLNEMLPGLADMSTTKIVSYVRSLFKEAIELIDKDIENAVFETEEELMLNI